MGSFKPYKSGRELEILFFGTLNQNYRRAPAEREDLLDALDEAGSRLKEIYTWAAEANRKEIKNVFARLRRERDPMVDAVQLNEKGEVIKIWTPYHLMPTYRDLAVQAVCSGKLNYVFFPEDAQIFFRAADEEQIKKRVGLEERFDLGKMPPREEYLDPEEMRTAFVNPALMRLLGDFMLVKVVFVEDECCRRALGVVNGYPLLNPVLIGCKCDIDSVDLKELIGGEFREKDVQKINIQPENNHSFLAGILKECLGDWATDHPYPDDVEPLIYYERPDRCDVNR